MSRSSHMPSKIQLNSDFELSEAKLWQAFQEGNKQAYASIYQRFAPLLLRYGRKITSETQGLEDAIQDLFIELWKGRSNLSPTTSIQFYLFRALRNKLSRLYRIPPQASIEVSMDHEGLFSVPMEDIWIAEEEASHQSKVLQRAIGRLSQRQQEVIHLRYYQHFDSRQIAELMNINDQSVRNLLYTALGTLKKILSYCLFYLIFKLLS